MNTKERFLKVSGDLFSSQGYSGTGLKQIASEAGAPFGSLYHHFPGGKEQLGAEATLRAGQQDAKLLAAAFAQAPSFGDAIRRIFNAEGRRLKASDFKEGCPVASVAMDVVSTVDSVRAACSMAFADWEQIITAAAMRSGIEEEKARGFASFVLSALEGATILSRTHRTTAPLRQAADMIDLALGAILNRTGQG